MQSVISIQWVRGVFHLSSSLLGSRRLVEIGIKKLREKALRELAAQNTGRTKNEFDIAKVHISIPLPSDLSNHSFSFRS